MKTIVCDLVMYGRGDGIITDTVIKTIKKGVPVNASYVEKFNSNTKTHAKAYVEDEEKTKKWNIDHKATIEKRRQEDAARQLVGGDALRSLLSGVATQPKTEEQIRAEIRAEIEAEEKAKQVEFTLNKSRNEEGGRNA